ncbi:MAG: DUF2807 domain-containing protein [Muribaculaceae bacterium]|nr:DUF2807 domain-containing protein [Muribaculaceae bacterium]
MIRLALAIALLMATPSSAFDVEAASPAIEKPGLERYTFEVRQFSTLCVQDNVNVVYTCSNDSTARIYYESEPDFADAFIFTDNGETLKIQVTTEDVGKPGMPTLHVSSRRLERVENYSDFSLRVEEIPPCQEFSASLVGNGTILINDINAHNVSAKITAGMGTIILTGKCSSAHFKLTGAGTIQADRLKADYVTCKTLGGGSITTYPLKSLNIRGLGSTKIYYRGDPKIKRSGSPRPIPIEQ